MFLKRMQLQDKHMVLNLLRSRPDFNKDTKFNEATKKLNKLLTLLSEKSVPNDLIIKINSDIEALNSSDLSVQDLSNDIIKERDNIITVIQKELNLVTKNHYRNIWLIIGMTIFGVPLGLLLGVSVGNIGLLGVGLPIGLGIGILVGTAMDKKALNEGRQLNIE